LGLKVNHVKQALREGKTCFGTMLRMVRAPEVISLCAAAGWDFVVLDTEHYGCNPENVSALALAARYEKITFLMRVPDKLYHQMANALDLGAEGLVLPRVDRPEQVQTIIRSSKFYPVGQRGMSVSIFGTLHREYDVTEYMEWFNSSSLVAIQIESREGVENANQLVSIPGVDAVLIGPADLSQNLGISGQFSHPDMEDAYQKVIDACNRHGVAPGIHFSEMDLVEKWVARGMRFITFQYDTKLLLDASKKTVEGLRQVLDK